MAAVSRDPGRAVLAVSVFSLSVFGLGVIFLFMYGLAPADSSLARLSASLLTALAAFMVGALVGFLSGIPMAVSVEAPVPAGSNSNAAPRLYRPNNTLQQVSDWLLKLLLGAGLAQLANLYLVGESLAPLVGDATAAMVICFLFAVVGFFFGYVVTAFYLAPLFPVAGSDILGQVGQEITERLTERLSLTTVENDMYRSVYEPPPQGFETAIKIGEKYLSEYPQGSADIFGHLATAYGQKYRHRVERENVAADSGEALDLAQKAVEYAKKAVALDANWKTILLNLFDAPPGAFEDDWQFFKLQEENPSNRIVKQFVGSLRA
jgi:hypothetical protein